MRGSVTRKDPLHPWDLVLRTFSRAYVHAKLLQLCLTLCDPMDCSLPGPSVHGDSPGKNTGVDAMPSSMGSSQPKDRTCVSYVSWHKEFLCQNLAGGFFTACTTWEARGLYPGLRRT